MRMKTVETMINISVVLQLLALMAQIDGLELHCGNSVANALELLQSCTKPSE